MGAEKEPSLYRCTVAVAPVTDLRRFVSGYRRSFFHDINMPQLVSDRDTLDETSPSKHADQIRGPVLLIHGGKDYTVETRESIDMESALKSEGKSVKAIYFDDEDHYFTRESDRTNLLKAIEAFLATNLGPGFRAEAGSLSTLHNH